MKKKSSIPGEVKPFMDWQTGEYERFQQINHEFPIAFLLLCKLTGTTPERILKDFTDNLSCSAKNRKGRDEAKQNLVDYFIAHHYGQQFYTPDEIREMFKDMDAVGRLFPENDDDMIEVYGHWRDQQYKSWFTRWFNKLKRII